MMCCVFKECYISIMIVIIIEYSASLPKLVLIGIYFFPDIWNKRNTHTHLGLVCVYINYVQSVLESSCLFRTFGKHVVWIKIGGSIKLNVVTVAHYQYLKPMWTNMNILFKDWLSMLRLWGYRRSCYSRKWNDLQPVMRHLRE